MQYTKQMGNINRMRQKFGYSNRGFFKYYKNAQKSIKIIDFLQQKFQLTANKKMKSQNYTEVASHLNQNIYH